MMGKKKGGEGRRENESGEELLLCINENKVIIK
jgi:hypothetical protein